MPYNPDLFMLMCNECEEWCAADFPQFTVSIAALRRALFSVAATCGKALTDSPDFLSRGTAHRYHPKCLGYEVTDLPDIFTCKECQKAQAVPASKKQRTQR